METRVVTVDIRRYRALLEAPESFTSEGRLRRCMRETDPARRMQGFAAELALSYALSGSELSPPRYEYDASGRPVTDGAFISLSHSGTYAVCAVSDVPVGVDIEMKRQVSPSVSRRVLSPKELEEYGQTGDGGLLLRRFVIKEAFLKLTGEGISGGMSSLFPAEGRLFRKGVLAGFYSEFEHDDRFCCVVTSEERSVIYEPFSI